EAENMNQKENEKDNAPLNDENAHKSLESHCKNFKGLKKENDELFETITGVVDIDTTLFDKLKDLEHDISQHLQNI
ncbi:merozoite surface protein 3, putative, partial [Plasmodium ovale curtisi]